MFILRKTLSIVLIALFIVGCGRQASNPLGPEVGAGSPPESIVVQKPNRNPGVTPEAGTYWLRASSIERVWDRNENEWDYLIVFKLPINYCPSWMKVYAQNWYGGLGTPYVNRYHVGMINGVYTVKYLAGSRVIAWYGSDPSRYYLEFPI